MTVGYEVRDSIAHISFNRPGKPNAPSEARAAVAARPAEMNGRG